MPIYEYECRKCGHHTELLQKFSDPSITKCELCQGRMKKLISQSTFHLKGSGWYVTDYASNRDGNSDGNSDKKDTNSAKNTATKEAKSSTDQPKKETSSTSAKNDKD